MLRQTGEQQYQVTFTGRASVDRIIYSIFQRFNLEWKNPTLKLLHKPIDITVDWTLLT